MYWTDLLVLQRRPSLSKLVLTQNRKILHRIEAVLRCFSQKILYLRISRHVRTRSYTIRYGLTIQKHLFLRIERGRFPVVCREREKSFEKSEKKYVEIVRKSDDDDDDDDDLFTKHTRTFSSCSFVRQNTLSD